jgi:hypothetical protein
MDLDLDLEDDGRIVVLDGSRLAGLKHWHLLADVAALTSAVCSANGVLLDVRQAAFTPEAREGEVLAVALASFPAVAIVTGGEASYGCARMVCTLVGRRGSPAAAFLSEGEAKAWLARQGGALGDDSAVAKRQGQPRSP